MTLENIMRSMPWQRATMLSLAAFGTGAGVCTMFTRSLGTCKEGIRVESISPRIRVSYTSEANQQGNWNTAVSPSRFRSLEEEEEEEEEQGGKLQRHQPLSYYFRFTPPAPPRRRPRRRVQRAAEDDPRELGTGDEGLQ
jgi:hypothetical protein